MFKVFSLAEPRAPSGVSGPKRGTVVCKEHDQVKCTEHWVVENGTSVDCHDMGPM